MSRQAALIESVSRSDSIDRSDKATIFGCPFRWVFLDHHIGANEGTISLLASWEYGEDWLCTLRPIHRAPSHDSEFIVVPQDSRASRPVFRQKDLKQQDERNRRTEVGNVHELLRSSLP